jgi:hypothetical protein
VPENAWLTIVIGFSGAVAILAVALVTRALRPTRAPADSTGRSMVHDDEPRGAGVAPIPHRGWALRSFGPWHRRRSVETNLQRAFARIDAVDPYAMPRRIGSALAETGLWSETEASRPTPPAREPRFTSGWPFARPSSLERQVRDRPERDDGLDQPARNDRHEREDRP